MAADPGFDAARLGVFGGSYGGFATLLCATQMPDVWKCAVDMFGVSNLVTMIENAQPNWRRFLARWIGDLEHDREKLIERSPVTYVDRIRCPMFVEAGQRGSRVDDGGRVPHPGAARDVSSMHAQGR